MALIALVYSEYRKPPAQVLDLTTGTPNELTFKFSILVFAQVNRIAIHADSRGSQAAKNAD